MQMNDVPHLGFDKSVITSSVIVSANLKKILKHITVHLNNTSTPYKDMDMDVSFTKYYQNMLEAKAQIDNDSGYVSYNHESNSDSALEMLSGSSQIIMANSEVKSVYLSEDALLEKPDVYVNLINKVNGSSEEDKSDISNEVIQASVSVENEQFSVFNDESYISNTSDVVSEILPIVMTLPVINNDQSINCDISNDSNIENNMNSLNVASTNDSQTSKCTQNKMFNNKSLCDISKPLNNAIEKDCTYNLHQNRTIIDSNISKKKLKTPKKSYRNSVTPNYSPELFSDDDIKTNIETEVVTAPLADERYILKKDRILMKKVQKNISGVIPPPSLTTIHLTVDQMLEKIEKNSHLFLKSEPNIQHNSSSYSNSGASSEMSESNENIAICSLSLLITSSLDNCLSKPWPNIMEERFHGLHYNRSKLSEEFEMLCMKYGMRYVSSDTQSTCTIFETNMSSPSKRKANKLRWGGLKSPGRRLSHLARRRITFSSANLQASSSGSTNSRQVMMDSRRLELLTRKSSPLKKSPRKTPRKSPKKRIRTPSSSAKKRLSMHLQIVSENIKNAAILKATTTKRALFQSPEHNRPGTSLSKPVFPSMSGSSGLSPFKKRSNTKCALFTSPLRKQSSETDNKRKRTDSEDLYPPKLPRSLSFQPGSTSTAASSSRPTGLSKVRSEMNLSTTHSAELSTHHKKKLQWAIYEALRSQNVGINHPQFRSFACNLAKITRKFLPNLSLNAPRPEGGTSDRMLRIAKQNAYAVTRGKTFEEIMQDFEKNRSKKIKPTGYISMENAGKSDISTARNNENILRDKFNIISNEKELQNSGMNRQALVRTLTKSDNKVDRVRKVINFDDNSHIGSNSIR